MRVDFHQACILLGSNIEPEVNIPKAVELLQENLTVLHASHTWETPSVDCCYPNYLNIALLVETNLEVKALKEQVLRPLEALMGRVRTEDKNASRTIDLDIILFDGTLMDSDLWKQAHRAIPVSELFPDYHSETGESLKTVARRLAQTTPIQLRKDVSVLLPSRN